MRLKGKVALIAGAGGGMGTAVPVLFAQEGAKVVLAARREGPLQEIADRIKQQGGEATWVTADLVTEAGAQKTVQHAVETYGRLDILFNNLGDSAGRGLRLHETPEETWDYLTDINLKGQYLCAKAAIPGMITQGGGVIIHNIADHPVRLRAHSGYGAGKWGLIGFTKSLARNYHKDNIRVVAIAPPGIGNDAPEGAVQVPDSKVNRPGRAEDVAYAALYLASDEASWVSGVILPVDGGQEVLVDVPPDAGGGPSYSRG